MITRAAYVEGYSSGEAENPIAGLVSDTIDGVYDAMGGTLSTLDTGVGGLGDELVKWSQLIRSRKERKGQRVTTPAAPPSARGSLHKEPMFWVGAGLGTVVLLKLLKVF